MWRAVGLSRRHLTPAAVTRTFCRFLIHPHGLFLLVTYTFPFDRCAVRVVPRLIDPSGPKLSKQYRGLVAGKK